MILTVTLNAAIDRTVAVPNFRLGHRHRAVESRTVAGGKGINVARALSLLGRPVIATGFAGGPTGTRVLEQLREESVLTDFTRIAGETRINLAVIDPTSGEQTEINERGPAVSPEEVERFVERLDYLAGGAKICVLAGTLPPGAGDDLYARLVKELRERDVIVVLDAEGEAMLAGLRAGASVVTPNEREAEELVGQEFSDRGDLVHGLRAGPARRRGGGDHAAGRLRRGGRRGRRAALPRGPHRAAGPGLDGRLRRRLPGRLRRRAATTAARPRIASPTESPAAPSRPSTSAPAPSTAARSSACSTRSRCTTWRSPRKCSLAFQRHPAWRTNWRSTSVEARRGGAPTDSMTSRSFRRAAPAIPTTLTSAGRSARIASSCRSSLRRWTGSSAPTRQCSSTSWAASECSTWRGSGPASRTPRSSWRRSPPRPSTRRPGSCRRSTPSRSSRS